MRFIEAMQYWFNIQKVTNINLIIWEKFKNHMMDIRDLIQKAGMSAFYERTRAWYLTLKYSQQDIVHNVKYIKLKHISV